MWRRLILIALMGGYLMAGISHKLVGTTLTQAEFEQLDSHLVDPTGTLSYGNRIIVKPSGTSMQTEINAGITAAGVAGSLLVVGSPIIIDGPIISNVNHQRIDIPGTIQPTGAINALEMAANYCQITLGRIEDTDNDATAVLVKQARFNTVLFTSLYKCNYGLRIGDEVTDALVADNTWRGDEVRDCKYGIVAAGFSATNHAEGQDITINFLTNLAVAPIKMIHMKQHAKYQVYRGDVHNQIDAVKEIDDDCGYNLWQIGFFSTGFEGDELDESIVIAGKNRSLQAYFLTIRKSPFGFYNTAGSPVFTITDGGQIRLVDSNLTISGGVITVTGSIHGVDTEGGAASDDLDTINGQVSGGLLILHSVAGARNVVVKHGTGNIYLVGGADFTLDEPGNCIFLRGTSAAWYEINRSTAN